MLYFKTQETQKHNKYKKFLLKWTRQHNQYHDIRFLKLPKYTVLTTPYIPRGSVQGSHTTSEMPQEFLCAEHTFHKYNKVRTKVQDDIYVFSSAEYLKVMRCIWKSTSKTLIGKSSSKHASIQEGNSDIFIFKMILRSQTTWAYDRLKKHCNIWMCVTSSFQNTEL